MDVVCPLQGPSFDDMVLTPLRVTKNLAKMDAKGYAVPPSVRAGWMRRSGEIDSFSFSGSLISVVIFEALNPCELFERQLPRHYDGDELRTLNSHRSISTLNDAEGGNTPTETTTNIRATNSG